MLKVNNNNYNNLHVFRLYIFWSTLTLNLTCEAGKMNIIIPIFKMRKQKIYLTQES